MCPVLICSYVLSEGVTEQMHNRHHLSETVFVISFLQVNSWIIFKIVDEHQFLNPQKLVFVSRCVQKLWKATDNFIMSVCVEQLGSHWLDFDWVWYLSIFFKKSVKKCRFNWNLTRIIGTLREDIYTFVIPAHWILSNKEIYAIVKKPLITETIRLHRLRWFGLFREWIKGKVVPLQAQSGLEGE
jgi:hypothetical protein